jgi:hypothetical protein
MLTKLLALGLSTLLHACAGPGPAGTSGPDGGSAGSLDGSSDEARSYALVYESNAAATPAGGDLRNGQVAFRLPAFPEGITASAIRLFTRGDRADFGGGGLSVEIVRGRPDQPGSTRLAFGTLGGCLPGADRCWTGPDFEQSLFIPPGELDVWVVLENSSFEGGDMDLPLGGTDAPGPNQETWVKGLVSWKAGAAYETHADWTAVPAPLPWMWRLLLARPGG